MELRNLRFCAWLQIPSNGRHDALSSAPAIGPIEDALLAGHWALAHGNDGETDAIDGAAAVVALGDAVDWLNRMGRIGHAQTFVCSFTT